MGYYVKCSTIVHKYNICIYFLVQSHNKTTGNILNEINNFINDSINDINDITEQEHLNYIETLKENNKLKILNDV